MIHTESIPVYSTYRHSEEKIGFQISDLEQANSYDASRPHRHNYYEVFLFVRGGGDHELDMQSIEINDSSLHFTSPGQVHLLRRTETSSGYVLMFSKEFFQMGQVLPEVLYEFPFLNNSCCKPVISLDASQFAYFQAMFEAMMEEKAQFGSVGDEEARSYLNLLLFRAKKLYDGDDSVKSSASAGQALVARFRQAVDTHFSSTHTVQEYAALLFVSPGHLNDTVKSILGITAHDFIQQRRVLEIKRLLFHSEFSLRAIGESLGFEDQSYFAKFFRRHTGLKPRQYRQISRGKHQ